jgi:hypothetical protein
MAESGEERLLAIAAARPLKIMDPPVDVKNHSQFGVDGHISIHPVQDEEGVILVVNVLMPSQRDESGIWYSLLEDKIRDAIRVFKACIERVIVAGYLPFEQESRRFKDFLLSLGFKDTGSGLCQSAERCQTASPENGIFLVTRGDESPAQLDRIMTHRFAYILSAGANFTRILETTDYKDNYGLSRVWASQRYGWVARTRLPICPSK